MYIILNPSKLFLLQTQTASIVSRRFKFTYLGKFIQKLLALDQSLKNPQSAENTECLPYASIQEHAGEKQSCFGGVSICQIELQKTWMWGGYLSKALTSVLQICQYYEVVWTYHMVLSGSPGECIGTCSWKWLKNISKILGLLNLM